MERFFAVLNSTTSHNAAAFINSLPHYRATTPYIAAHFACAATTHQQPAGGFFSGLLQHERYVVAGQIRIDNRAELLRRLAPPIPNNSSTKQKCAHSCDAALVLAAHRRWPNNCAKYLVGDFAFVIWDTATQQLYAARDPMNMRPLYYIQHNKGLHLSSSMEDLLQLPQLQLDVNKDCLAGWLSGYPTADTTPFKGLHALPAGHHLVDRYCVSQHSIGEHSAGKHSIGEKGAVSSEAFWQLNTGQHLHYKCEQDYQTHLFELLEQAVADRLPRSPQVVATQMSGGMDSTSVTALAQALLSPAKSLQVVSHSYKATRNCDESAHVNAMIKHLQLPNVHYLDAEKHVHLNFTELYPPAIESPGTVLSPRYQDEMALLSELNARVLFTGNGGDEMCWGHSLSYSERLKSGDVRVLGEALRGCKEQGLPLASSFAHLFIKPLLPAKIKQLKRKLHGQTANNYPAWLTPSATALLDKQAQTENGEPLFDNPALQARYLGWKNTSTLNSVRSYQQVAAHHGISVVHPFFDRRILEFSFAIPHHLWLRQNRPKWLLRKCMEQHLPASVCWNPQKTIFDAYFGKILQAQAPLIRNILSDTRLQSMGLINNTQVLAHFNACVGAAEPSLNVDLLYVLLTQIWFQKYARHFKGWH